MSLQWKKNYNVFIYFQVFYILLYTYILDQAKNVPNMTKLQQIKTLVNLPLSFSLSAFLSLHRFKMFVTSISSILDLIVVSI